MMIIMMKNKVLEDVVETTEPARDNGAGGANRARASDCVQIASIDHPNMYGTAAAQPPRPNTHS